MLLSIPAVICSRLESKDHRKDAIYFSNTYRADQSPIIIPIFRELRLNHSDMPHARLHESTVYITYLRMRYMRTSSFIVRHTVPHNLSTPAGRSSLTATLIELQLQGKLDVVSIRVVHVVPLGS